MKLKVDKIIEAGMSLLSLFLFLQDFLSDIFLSLDRESHNFTSAHIYSFQTGAPGFR